jgi:hypothetical protein
MLYWYHMGEKLGCIKKDVSSAKSSRIVRGLGKVLVASLTLTKCNMRRPRLEHSLYIIECFFKINIIKWTIELLDHPDILCWIRHCQKWVANPVTQWLVNGIRFIVAISRCLVASCRDFEKTTWQLYSNSKTLAWWVNNTIWVTKQCPLQINILIILIKKSIQETT